MKDEIQKRNRLKIIQLSDLHLFSSHHTLLLGHQNNNNFFDVLRKIKNEHLDNTDLIFLTGDLSQDQTKQSYEHILFELQHFNIPVYWIPGNHDQKNTMLEVFSNNALFRITKSLELKHWVFLFLDTQKKGADSGFLNNDEIFFLYNAIKKNSHKNITIIMHHHPMPFNTPLIDQYPLENHEEFWKIINQSSVKKIICGHVHGDYSLFKNNVQIESSAATCFQFKKGASQLDLENNIGYKIHYFEYNRTGSQSEIWMEPHVCSLDCTNGSHK